MASKKERKGIYFTKLTNFLTEYKKILLISVTNVGAAVIQETRKKFRGRAEILMGKNTMIRKCLRQFIDAGNPEYEALLNKINGNIGMVFTNGDLAELRTELTEHRIPAPAKAGVVAPLDVSVPAGPTGLEPTATSFLQALNIASKIVRGQIEITNPVQLVFKGEKVKPGAAALLLKLNITPFSYGIEVPTVFDNGFVYGAELLDLTDEDVLAAFSRGVTRIAALGMQIGYPSLATVPHSIAKAYQSLLAVATETNYNFEGVAELREMLANPDAFKAAAPVVEEKVEEAAPVVEEESSSEEMELDLFG